jgi:homocysteine S-methyltransferase
MTMNPITTILRQYPVMILDGGLATELEQFGCDLRDELWSAKVLIEAPDLIKQVHAAYYRAGADCAITASYQATFEGFARRGYSHAEAAQFMRLAVQLAVEARDEFWADPANRVGRPRPLVAASIGSYGAFLADGSEYTGDYDISEEALIAFHRPRLAILAATNADLLACETVPCLLEAQALTHLLREFPDRHAWISFSARDSTHTCHGELLADCAAWLDPHQQIVAVGVNCSAPRFIPDLVRASRAATHKPIVVYPNSGEVYHPEDHSWTGFTEARAYADQARGWHANGAQIIGGCCRTTPAEIQAIAGWVRHLP